MLTHNTHYATTTDTVFPMSGRIFYVICYTLPGGCIRWMCKNRRLSVNCSSAVRFSSFYDAYGFCAIDFLDGRCEILVFCWSATSSCYFSSHGYTRLGGRTEWCAGQFSI